MNIDKSAKKFCPHVFTSLPFVQDLSRGIRMHSVRVSAVTRLFEKVSTGGRFNEKLDAEFTFFMMHKDQHKDIPGLVM